GARRPARPLRVRARASVAPGVGARELPAARGLRAVRRRRARVRVAGGARGPRPRVVGDAADHADRAFSRRALPRRRLRRQRPGELAEGIDGVTRNLVLLTRMYPRVPTHPTEARI